MMKIARRKPKSWELKSCKVTLRKNAMQESRNTMLLSRNIRENTKKKLKFQQLQI